MSSESEPTTQAPTSPAEPHVGEFGLPFPQRGKFGNYELLEEIGRGGMGVVFKARQSSPSRLVALKMLLAGEFAEVARRVRFIAEGDAIARLRHPHIVQIHEVAQHDGLPFLVLEFVD